MILRGEWQIFVLQLNEDETEVVILGCPVNSSPALEVQLGPLSTNVRNKKN